MNSDFDVTSRESHGTSFTVAGVRSGCRWFALEFEVMYRSEYTQLPGYYNSLNPIFTPIDNRQTLHTYNITHINPVSQLISDERRYGFNPRLF